MMTRKDITHKIYMTVALNAVLLFLIIGILSVKPAFINFILAIYLPAVLILNILFLHRKSRAIDSFSIKVSTKAKPQGLYIYGCSAIFFAGTIYGFLLIAQGEFPWIVSPLLLFPLLISVYCLKVARRMNAPAPNEDDAKHSRP